MKRLAWPILPLAFLSGASQGTGVSALGFPITSNVQNTYGPNFTSRITGVSVFHEGYELYSANLGLEPGTSGGPVFNQKGQIVGVVYGGRELTNRAYFTPANVLAHFLNQLGIVR
ncbi:trypsin-like peptidase domain-containing protein [Ramlibacter terrae]|uniref:Trypsin-like peptidase domain-containing protein n=1 Tax=Ramlibacter terrae TaxID=2732511 RepID=A0ABX6P5P7_9BURK|nr:trypsin-like peptidase domain-containing protein [Ramlibacter terrae]